MDALSSLAMYSDSEDDEDPDQEMEDKESNPSNNNKNVTQLLSLNLYNSPSPKSKSTPKAIKSSKHTQSPSPPLQLDYDTDDSDTNNNNYIFTTAPPQIPSSPDIKPNPSQQQLIKNLLNKHKTHEQYYQNTFHCMHFEDDPEWFDTLLSKLKLFEYQEGNDNTTNNKNEEIKHNEIMEWKLDEYASNLSESIHEITQWRDKDDNVDTLMRLLEGKIRENERRIQEKRERKERERQQIMKDRIERRVPTPTVNYGYSARYQGINNSVSVLNAAKNAVLAKKNQFIMNKNKQLKEGIKSKKRSRWDDK